MRGFDLARNPGLSNNTEYGAGEFPLPARPPVGLAAQSTSRPSSMIRSQQTEEAYPDLSSLKRELERAQREKDKAKEGAREGTEGEGQGEPKYCYYYAINQLENYPTNQLEN